MNLCKPLLPLVLAVSVGGCGRDGAAVPAGTPAEVPVPVVAASPTRTPVGENAASPFPEAGEVHYITPAELAERIASHKGRAVLVDFWASWCQPCRKQFPHTVALSRKYPATDLVVIAVSLDERDKQSETAAQQFLTEQGGADRSLFQCGGRLGSGLSGLRHHRLGAAAL